jgi:hypothetical protein
MPQMLPVPDVIHGSSSDLLDTAVDLVTVQKLLGTRMCRRGTV